MMREAVDYLAIERPFMSSQIRFWLSARLCVQIACF